MIPLTFAIVIRGLAGLVLFGTTASVLIITPLLLPWDFGVADLVGAAPLVFAYSLFVWTAGALFVALPIWIGFHRLGLRDWTVAVAGGAGLVGLIWFLGGGAELVAAARGALAGAAAGWGMWWMAYGGFDRAAVRDLPPRPLPRD